ncbi:Aldo/keto reductase family protein [compost metagenome]
MHQFWAQWEDDIYWLEELQQLKQEGKVKNIGISVPDHRHDLAISIVRSGLIDSIQTIVNIFDPTALDSLVPVCKANQVAVIARVVLDEGGLTGFLTKDTVIPPKDFQRNYFDCLPRSIYLDKVEALRQFIPSSAESLTELAIRFVLQDPGITSAIISMHIHEYALENIQAASKPKLDDEVFEIIRQQHRWIRNFFQARRFV